MKNSEELRAEANQEESDLAYLGKINKATREERLEKLEDGYIQKLEAKNILVVPFDGQKYILSTNNKKFPIVDYYPKANKILIRKGNKWIVQGLRWINESLLN